MVLESKREDTSTDRKKARRVWVQLHVGWGTLWWEKDLIEQTVFIFKKWDEVISWETGEQGVLRRKCSWIVFSAECPFEYKQQKAGMDKPQKQYQNERSTVWSHL